MSGRIGLYTFGMWRLRDEVAVLTGLVPERRLWSTRGLSAVAGWGFKAPARLPRFLARRSGLPYVAIEDGFFRSLSPGRTERSLSLVADATGIYYDARGPSALEALIHARAADPASAERDAAAAIRAIREEGVSKYNLFDPVDRARFRAAPGHDGAVLVIDQTRGDAAIAGAGAGPETFAAMLAAAAAENPGARLLVKTHPETQIGRRSGHFAPAFLDTACAHHKALAEARRAGRLVFLTGRIAPIDLFARVGRVYAVSSLLGFEALVAGRPVTLFGRAFYSGWGLTDDRAPPTGRRGPVPLGCLVAAVFRDYPCYFDPATRRPCPMETVVAHLAGPRAEDAVAISNGVRNR